MKKLLSFLIVLSMVASIFVTVPIFAAEKGILSLSSAEAEKGGTATLELNLENNPGVMAMQIYVKYDKTALSFPADKNGQKNGELFENLSRGVSPTFYNTEEDAVDDGLVGKFIFTVNENARPGDYEIEIQLLSAGNWDETLSAADFTTINGTITVKGDSYSNCVDANGNPLNPYFVNGNIWTETDGAIKPAVGAMENFLLFDNALTVNRVEATFKDLPHNYDGNTRNGIVFALSDIDGDHEFGMDSADVSYWFACISGYGEIQLIKMGEWNPYLTANPADLGIDVFSGVTLAVEWNADGNIKVFANGALAIETNQGPLTGNLYGILMRSWSNTEGGGFAHAHTVTSFVAGGALATPEKVEVTVDPVEGGTVTGAGDYYLGQQVTLTATPADGYNFGGWYENGVLISDAGATYTFKVTQARDLTVKFTTKTYTVTVTPGENGTAEGAGEYGEGASVTLTAKPAAGYKLVGWFENGSSTPVSTSTNYTFTVTADRTLTAKFEKITSYSIAVDGDGNLLNPYFVSGNIWSEADGAIKPAPGAMENFILFDNALAINRVEATFRDLPLNNDGDTRNGIVFALTDIDGDHAFGMDAADVSYYFVCVSGFGEVQLIQMGAGKSWTNYTTGGSVDVASDVTLAVEWDAEGNIRVFANGELRIEKKVDDMLTGKLYGVLMRSWSNTEGGGFAHTHTVTSFVAGGALAIKDVNVNATVNPTEGGSVSGTGDYYLGQSVTLTATPNTGYAFVGWYNGETEVSKDKDYTFTATENCTLTAKFTASTFTVTVTPEGDGTVTGGGDVAEGASATVTATPNVGYKFAGWYENDVLVSDAGATYTFTVTGNRTLTAKFEKVEYTVPVDAEGNPLNPYFVNGVTWVEEDGKLKMPAGNEYSFLLFDNTLAINRVEATITANDLLANDGSDRNGIVFALTDHDGDGNFKYSDADVSYYWAFINDWGSVEVVEMGKYENWTWLSSTKPEDAVNLEVLGIDVKQGVTLAVEWDAEGNIRVFANGILVQEVKDETPLTGKLYGLLVRKWGNTQTPNTYDAPVTSFIAGGALATPDNEVNVTVDPTEGGTFTGNGNYYLGQNVTLTATANEGYTFAGWYENGALVSSEATITFKATADRNLTAKFTNITYTVTVTPGANGTATGAGSYGENANATVTATPNTGYKFAGWYVDGNKVSADAAYTFTVTEDITLVAEFEKVTYSIAVDDEGTVLNPYFVNGNTWTEADGAIKPAPGAMENFILFDNALAINRVEATFRDLPLNNDGDTRNGIVFALTDIDGDHAFGMDAADVSYYFVCVSGFGEVQLIQMGAGKSWTNYTTGGSVDVASDVTLAVEWDAEGNIRVFANGELRIEKKVDDMLTGKLYGVLMRSWSNTEGGGFAHTHTVTSFVAGGALAIKDVNVNATVNPTEGGSVSGTGDYYLGQSVTLTATANAGYKFIGWFNGETKVSTDATYTFTAEADLTLTAKFEKENVHTCTGTKVPGQGATCTVDGWNDYYECSCGKYFKDANATAEITDLDAWKKGEGKIAAGHNYGTLVNEDPGKHTATELKDGMKAHYHCDKCNKYFTAEKVETTKEALVIKNAHAYGTEWGYKGADGHAHVCECGAKDTVLAHTPNIAAPTETEDQVCTACGHVIANKLNHVHKDNLTEVKAKDADCTNDGNKAYYTCSCGKWFTDNTATTEITDKNSVVIKAGHNYGTLVNEDPGKHTATELVDGMKAHYYCDKCDKYFTAEKVETTKEALVIKNAHAYGTEWGYKGADGHAHVCECGAKDTVLAHTPNIAAPTEDKDQVCSDCGYIIANKLGHVHADNLTEVKAKDATCTENGNIAYYECECGKWFTDNTATTEITDKNSVVIKAGHNYGTLVEEVPAVHTKDELKAGMKAHYYCDKCDKYFTAEKVETTKEALVIAAPTHADANNDGKCDVCDYDMNPDVPEIPSTTVDLGGNVTLEGKDLVDGMFTFELYSADANFATSGTPVTVTNKDGKFAFENITFTEAGVYYFVITANVAEGTEGITFDESEYQVTVTVEENEEGDLAVVSTVITKKGASGTVNDMGFTNVYEPTDTPPQTGDATLWVCLAAVILSGMAVVGKFFYTKKRRLED